MAANTQAVCDVCSNAVDSPGGYLLVTRQVAGSPRYWQAYFEQNQIQFQMMGVHTFKTFLQNPGLRENAARAVAGQKTPWVVCEACIPLFEVDRNTARRYAGQWWQSGGKFRPPGSGPAPLSAVLMEAEPEKKKSPGALSGLLGPLRARQLWKRINDDLKHKDRQKGVENCTELLGLLNERSKDPSKGNVYCARANYHLALDEYDQAVEDFASAAIFYRECNEGANVFFMEEKMRLAHALQLEAQTPAESELKARMQELRQYNLSLSIHPNQESFTALLEGLEDEDPQACAYANKLIAALPFGLKTEYEKWTVEYYRANHAIRPKSASLAARMLGRRLFPAPQDTFSPEIGRVKFGVLVGFANATCAHCGYLNLGIPVPTQGIYAPLFSQIQAGGDCQAPVICDRCNRLFYLTW